MITKDISYKFTDKEVKTLLDNMVILIDTREQQSDHIVKYLDKHDIKHKTKRLEFGDYSFKLKSNEETKQLGINRSLYFDSNLVIERKGAGAVNNGGGLNELVNNFCKGRAAFRNEMIRGKETKLTLLIEDSSLGDLVNGNYRSKMNAKSLLGSLMSWKFRYNLEIMFIPKKLSGLYIYYSFYYYLKEYLK